MPFFGIGKLSGLLGRWNNKARLTLTHLTHTYPLQASVLPSTASTPVQASCGISNITVLQLEVLLDQQQDRLLLQPPAQDFLEGLAAWLRGLAAMARDVPQLLQHLHLQVKRLEYTGHVYQRMSL